MEPVDEIIETLHEYDTMGMIDEFTVDIWPDELRLTDDTTDSSVRAHYDRLQTWADDHGVSLEPAFTRRKGTTLVREDSDPFVVFPVLCLAIRLDGELVSVAPHSIETELYTVADALGDIESLPRFPPEDRSEFPPGHPVRSATTAHTSEDPPARTTDDALP